MKRVLFITFILLLHQIFNLYSIDYKSDKIYVFLESYQNGKKCKGIIIFNLEIYKVGKRISWTLKEVEISDSHITKDSTVNSFYSSSEMKNSRIGRIIWEPGKYFECEYYITNCEKPVVLKARKIEAKRYKWEVRGQGVMVIDGQEQKYEMVGKLKYKLKYKMLVVPDVFNE